MSDIDYLHEGTFRPDIRLRVSPSDLDRTRHLLAEVGADPGKPWVGLNPGAYFGGAKRWTTDRYAAVADRIIERFDAEIVIFGSAAERRIAQEISAQMRFRPRILAGRTDLETLMGALALCRLIITNDSGPMHLAAALERPLIALFGSTDEVATGPFSPAATVIHKRVECSPCLKRECPIDLRCFTRISVEEVLAAAAAHLETAVSPGEHADEA